MITVIKCASFKTCIFPKVCRHVSLESIERLAGKKNDSLRTNVTAESQTHTVVICFQFLLLGCQIQGCFMSSDQRFYAIQR